MTNPQKIALAFIAISIVGLLNRDSIGAWASIVIANLWWIEARRGRE